MSGFASFCNAVKAVFDFKSKKYDGSREDRTRTEKKEDAKWKRRMEGWKRGSAAQILNG